jgi:transcriptional regulator with XRE-family HTH domain
MKPDEIISTKMIGERVKFRRQDIGMSQERLAEILDVSYQQIQRYESGRNRLNVESIQVIAHALGVSITFFFDSSSTTESVLTSDSPDVKTLLKHFRQIECKPDRQAVVMVARRLASKQ